MTANPSIDPARFLHEQRLDAVRVVLGGASVTEVAAQVRVSPDSRCTHGWAGI
ncbi:hypothetical protein [Actinopolymorpha alba]|uniref:hypothetical protein n=1 Tax=Actinopolymorpha alba TaxID=533267 RepID=UPI0003A2BDAD|nr:hypothetical protein [Actinopolymorpha alba]